MNIEPILAALFTALNGAAGFNTKSRRLKHWDDVLPGAQPALFQAQGDLEPDTESGLPTKWVLSADLYIYARLQPNDVPGTVLNPLIDAVVNIVNARHPISGKNQLQLSNVAYCRVEGTVQIDEGTLDNQAVAIVPIKIFITD